MSREFLPGEVVGDGAESLVLHAQTGLLAFDEAQTSSLLIVCAVK